MQEVQQLPDVDRSVTETDVLDAFDKGEEVRISVIGYLIYTQAKRHPAVVHMDLEVPGV